MKFFNDIQEKHTQLEARLAQLEQKVAQPNMNFSASVTSDDHVEDDSFPLQSFTNHLPTQPQGTHIPPKPPQMVSDRKFNVVVYGIKESPSNTPKTSHLKCELESLLHVLSDINNSLNSSCIQDFHRLGKISLDPY